ncbi:MAG TPA: response regulator [Candidatus Aquilonibacter sp.]|nr:response regulator [Candidatus Aquilonibacter sp.]
MSRMANDNLGSPETLADFAHAQASKGWFLALLLLLFAPPLLGGTYWMYLQARQEVERGEMQNDLIQARALSAMVEKDLTSAESVLSSIADRPEVQRSWARGDFVSVSRDLVQARKLDPALLFVSAYDTQGTLKVITPEDRIVGWNFAYRDWYHGVTADWQPYVSEVYRTAAGSNPLVVAVAVPVRDAKGNPAGIVMATYSLADLTSKFRAIGSGSSADFYVFDQRGVLAASPKINAQSGPVRLAVPGVTDRARAGAEGSARTQINGEDLFVGFAPVTQLGWTVVYGRPANVALAPAMRLKREFRSMTLYLLLIYVATCAFAAFLVRRQSRLLAANQVLNRDLEAKISELKQTREELDNYFNLSVDLLCIAGEDGYFKRINPAWEKALGWSTEELLSQPRMRFVHPDDRDATSAVLTDLAHGQNVVAFENRYRCKDGSYRWLMWNAASIVDQQLIYAIARDVTEAKQTREALLVAKEDAERSNRFKDQFLSTMSHELRTPLNAVLGFSDLLTEARYGDLNDRQLRYIKHIQNGGKHLLRLINDILDLSKIEAGRLQLSIDNVRLANSVAEAVDTLRPLADQKSQILVQEIDPEISVRADSTRLRQVLTNLIGNAVKFTPGGGRIQLAALRNGHQVRVEVRDSGPGIPQAEQKRIFEAFYRLQHGEKAPEGTGLGLAITQRLVELHGGMLGIESEVGAGSCFYFTLPIVAPFAEQPRSSAANARDPRGSRVLVVEDDLSSAQLLESQLTSAGYGVVICRQPERALEMAIELHPSAITLDMVMHPMNGWELLSALKSDPRTAAIPAIVVSIVDQPGIGALLGADEYIVKPVDKAVLLTSIERCVSSREDGERSVLVVEDDDPTREFIAELLSKSGYTVTTASNGPEARRRVAAAAPALVILDLILPGISGFQLLRDWRRDARTSTLPVFVLTSKDLTPQEKQYLHANSESLFQKQAAWQESLLGLLDRVVKSPASPVAG